jgi:ubiquinone/menaquinone biosynthesis C-methylase UbiE
VDDVKPTYFMDDHREKERLAAKVDADAWVAATISPLLNDGDNVLEVGCGPGVLLQTVAQAPDVHVTGFDLSEDRLEEANRNFVNLPNATTVQGDAHHLPFDDGTFDFVYSRFLVEYLSDKQRAINEMARVLRPGGRLLLQDLDGQLVSHFPIDADLQRDIDATLQCLAETGFDPFVGRKLYHMARQAGLIELATTAESYHLYAGPIDAVNEGLWDLKLDIALPAMEKALKTREAAVDLKQRFMDHLRNEDTLTYSVLFTVVGRKR